MFLNKNRIVEEICELPTTLGDISESIFGGINTKKRLLHRLAVPEEGGPESLYLCEGLCKSVILEPELIYPYVSGVFSEKFAFNSSPYCFMLPYELQTRYGAECRLIPPEELKARFPMTHRRIVEFKNMFDHDNSPLDSADYYSVSGRKFLDYLNIPKIIATEGYRLQAAYDATGNHVFEEGCGIVLKDPKNYPYVTAVLNSRISRLFPSICEYEMIYSSPATPSVMKRFPILFPDDRLIGDLISNISSYLMFLNQQEYVRRDIAVNWLAELAGFYEQVSDLLVMDAYFADSIHPKLLDALEENIHPYAGDLESENNESLLNILFYIRQRILESSNFKKYGFGTKDSGILNFL